jgi:magnesium chelatase family protein
LEGGGGAIPKPGEISLSHRGVLFLDEFSEFDQKVIESLRQPLEDRQITISRAKGTITYPAQCILIISMNPCPCGRPIGNDCICSKKSLDRYQRKISGPIKDRIDIWINADKVDYDKLGNNFKSESSHIIKERIKKARTIQKTRFSKINSNKHFNSEITSDEIDSLINISNNARIKLMDLAQKLNISARAFHRTMKVARTIADLENEDLVQERHMLEAIQYRSKNN